MHDIELKTTSLEEFWEKIPPFKRGHSRTPDPPEGCAACPDAIRVSWISEGTIVRLATPPPRGLDLEALGGWCGIWFANGRVWAWACIPEGVKDWSTLRFKANAAWGSVMEGRIYIPKHREIRTRSGAVTAALAL